LKFSKSASNKLCAPKLIFFNEKIFFRKIWIIFDIENSLWKSEIGVLVGLTMTWFSEEMLISNICIRGFMCSAIKKSWKVSIVHAKSTCLAFAAKNWQIQLFSTPTLKAYHYADKRAVNLLKTTKNRHLKDTTMWQKFIPKKYLEWSHFNDLKW
jgi:hypothetical protein